MDKFKNTTSLSSLTTSESFYYAAIYGAIAWTVYAIAESCFLIILPWLIKPGYLYTPVHWGFTVLLFIIYPIIGITLGGLCGMGIFAVSKKMGWMQKVNPAVLFSLVATLTIILFFDYNFIDIGTFFQFPYKSTIMHTLFPFVISLSLIFALLLSSGSDIWHKRLYFITNPWSVCILLIGLPWTTLGLLSNKGTIYKSIGALLCPVVIILILFCVRRIIESRRVSKSQSSVCASPIRSGVFLTLIAFLVLGISFFLDSSPRSVDYVSKKSTQKTTRPNVILITMDTVRADHLSLAGYERDTTPNLRKLSKKATLHTNAIASGDMTLPTHASIFTGLYARQHGAHHTDKLSLGNPLSDKLNTLAEMLSQKGYYTAAVVANRGYLTHHFGFDQGFDYYDNRKVVLFLGSTPSYYVRNAISGFLSHFAPYYQSGLTYRRAEEINNEVFSQLKRSEALDNPFFLFINYMDAHNPYIPPPPFDSQYPGKDEGFTPNRYNYLYKEIMTLNYTMTENEHRHLVSQYDGEIAYIDHNIGKLILRLKELELYENSLIIITSDHGEVFGERDLMNHGVSVYQDQVYIPLVIKYPENNQGHVVDGLVSVVDLVPTVMDVLNYENPEGLQGRSLLSAKQEKPRDVFSESFPDGKMLEWHPRFHRIERAILSGPYKLINSTTGKNELYDLSKDPNEKRNLYGVNDSKSMELEAKLNQWLKDTKEKSGTTTKLDKDALERLKALGYVQ